MVYQVIFKIEEVIYLSILQKIDNEKDLEKEGYIVDGKIKHDDVIKAVNFLREEGFEGKIESLCFMYLGYKAPEYAKLIIIDDNANK